MLNKEQWTDLLRNILAMAMGYFISKGVLTIEQAATLTNLLLTAIPAIIAAAVTVWGIVKNTGRNKVLAAAQVPGVSEIKVNTATADAAVAATAVDNTAPSDSPVSKVIPA